MTSALTFCYYDGISRARDVLGYQTAAMRFEVWILEVRWGLLSGISWSAAFLIYLIGIVIFAGIRATMKKPVLKCEENPAEPGKTTIVPGESFPVPHLMVAYITRFMSNLLFFLMPTKFPYMVANMEADRILGENTALTAGIFLGMGGCA